MHRESAVRRRILLPVVHGILNIQQPSLSTNLNPFLVANYCKALRQSNRQDNM